MQDHSFSSVLPLNDLTAKVHAEALRFQYRLARAENTSVTDESSDHASYKSQDEWPSERIYKLLLKNVSREDPLTAEELQVSIQTIM